LQVGYMKRFDPSYEAALELLPGTAATLRHIAVEVNDPDAWPFVRHHSWQRSTDIAPSITEYLVAQQRDQATRAIGLTLDELAYRGFCGAYSSSLVHDVNAVHGLLDALSIDQCEIVAAQLYANGEGGHGVLRLRGGQALCTMTHLTVPRLPEYRERITAYFDDASLELEFPSPYLNHLPTQLKLKRGRDHRLVSEDIRVSYDEAFVEELKGFWAAVTGREQQRNTAEDARRDMELLCGFTRWHVMHHPTPVIAGVAA
jgi:predicted dehydrogenase